MTDEEKKEIKELIAATVAELVKPVEKEQLSPADAQLKANAEAKAIEDELNYKAGQISKFNDLEREYGAAHPLIFGIVKELKDKNDPDFYKKVDSIDGEILRVMLETGTKDKTLSERILNRNKNGIIKTTNDLKLFIAEEAEEAKKAEEEAKKQAKMNNRSGLENIKNFEDMTEEEKVAHARAAYANKARLEQQNIYNKRS